MFTNENERIKDELTALAVAMECSEAEAAREAVWQFYEAAGYTADRVNAEFGSMSDEEILIVYYDLY